MKNLWNAARRHEKQSFVVNFMLLIATIVLMASCKKGNLDATVSEVPGTSNNAAVMEDNPINEYTGLSSQTVWELQQARASSAKYLNINNAFADGYVDINVIVPNMGSHYLKAANLDATFDFKKPEILVYNMNEAGNLQLVAVEYAVPLNLSANAPEGFTGNNDVWDRNTGFGLWLLHAWVWAYNPAGVFNPTNPSVHTH